MRLDRAVMQDVADREPALGKRAGDQETTMAIERLALRAHQADAPPRRERDEAVEAETKSVALCHRLVVGDAVAIKIGLAWTAAERVAERRVQHGFLLQARFELFAGEPRKAAREWGR